MPFFHKFQLEIFERCIDGSQLFIITSNELIREGRGCWFGFAT